MNSNIIPLIIYPVNLGYVNDLKPTIHGTGQPFATINGTIDNTTFTATILDSGVWSYKLETELAEFTNHTINVIQTDSSGKKSPATSVEFKVNTKSLVTQTVTYPSANQYINTRKPPISGTGKAGAFIEATILKTIYSTVVNPDGLWQLQTEELPEGLINLSVVQKDMGNISPVLNLSFTIDTIAPKELEFEKPVNFGFENNPKPLVSGKGEADATIIAVVDNKEYSTVVNQSGAWSFEISETLIDDTHIISAKQKDAAGNISPEIINLFTVKTKQPEAPNISNPVNGKYLSEASPVISGKGEIDNRIEVRHNNKVYTALVNQDGTWEVKISDILSDGTHTFNIFQIDKAGNVSPCTGLSFKVDTKVPLAPVVLYPENESYVNNMNFTVKGTGEPDATIDCIVAGKNYLAKVKNDGSWSVNVCDNENISGSQSYSINAKQADMAGNESPTLRVKFKVDTEKLKAPQINSPSSDSVINTVNPTISGTGTAGAVLSVNINNKNYNTVIPNDGIWSISINDNLCQGENTVNVFQTDCGNTSMACNLTFVVDTIAPMPPRVIYPMQNQNIDSNNLIIKGEGEASAAIHLKLDDRCYKTTVSSDKTWEFSITEVLGNGSHIILVNQTDLAFNASAFSQICFSSNAMQPNTLADSNPIEYQIFYNPSGPDWASNVIAVLKTNKPVTVDNICGNVFSRVISSNGISTFDYTESDGNSATATAGVTWIDNKPPVVQVKSCGNIFSSDKTLTYCKAGGSSVKHALFNGAPFESGKIITEEGIYKIEVCDQVGNIATEDFVIDKTSPTVLGIENNKVYNTDVKITYFDNISGIKSATLDGNFCASGKTLTASGSYKFSITDFADNTQIGRAHV